MRELEKTKRQSNAKFQTYVNYTTFKTNSELH